MLSAQNDDPSRFLSHNYTHLIIGGGTAGLAVATRLSADPALKVGILEAGPAALSEPLINTPGRFGESLGSRYDWGFETAPQGGLGGRVLKWPRGKVLGGTSALNLMTWNRGNREDYDAWEELGAEGWGWEGLLPFFKKSETFHPPSPSHQRLHRSHHDPSFHGTSGPLQTTYSLQYGASHQHWHETLNNLGVATNRSHFSGSNVGVWTSLGSVDAERRERSYSANAYYRPVSSRENMVLLTEAAVQEVLLEKEGGYWVAKGIRFAHGGEEHVVRTDGEVIICAGSVQSPQLLELSGIGNPSILAAAGIECKIANPNVGENLQDHMMTATVYEISPSIATRADLLTSPALASAADHEYTTSHSGPHTQIPSSVAYLPFSHFTPSSTLSSSLLPRSPRTRLLVQNLTSPTPLPQIEYNLDLGNYNPYFPSQPGKKYLTLLQMLQYPFSRGSIHIAPSSPGGTKTTSSDHPVIDPKYYLDDGVVDFKLMCRAQRFGNRICSTEPLKGIIVERVCPPACEDEVEEWVRENTITDWHPVGTCAMGGWVDNRGGRMADGKDGERDVEGANKADDNDAGRNQSGFEAVVNPRLQVHGARGLRVCDASIMPLQIGAHLQATVYAIAEKGAAIIGEDWEDRRGVS